MADKKDPKSPATTSYRLRHQMLPQWQKMETLLCGTDAMRAAGPSTSPSTPRNRTTRTASGSPRHAPERGPDDRRLLGGQAVQRADQAVDDTSRRQLKDLFENIDLQGNSLDVFSRHWFRDGIAKGFSHVLVEFPRAVAREDGLPRSLEDDRPRTSARTWSTSSRRT
jgi:hypothetical protein